MHRGRRRAKASTPVQYLKAFFEGNSMRRSESSTLRHVYTLSLLVYGLRAASGFITPSLSWTPQTVVNTCGSRCLRMEATPEQSTNKRRGMSRRDVAGQGAGALLLVLGGLGAGLGRADSALAYGESAKLTFGGVGLGPGYAADCMLEDTATRQCLIRKGDKPPAWQGPDLQAAQTKFVSAVTRLEQAEAKLSKKRWMDAEACLQDMSLRPTINTGIMGLPEGDGRQAQGRAVSQTVFTSLEAASMGIRNRDATQATQAVQRALDGLGELSTLLF